MKRNLIALAVLSMVAAPAVLADSVNVSIYGRIRAAVESINADGTANNKSGLRLVDNSSTLGFKGSEELADGLMGIWQVESQFEADGDSDGKLASRNTFVGLKGGFGTVMLGRYDTPYKQTKKYLAHTPVDDSTAEISAIFGKFNNGSVSYYTRQASSLQYVSPNWSGFEFKVGYAPDEARNADQDQAKLSLSAAYDSDAFFIYTGYENRADQKVGAEYKAATAVTANGGVKFGKDGHIAVGIEKYKLDEADQTNTYLSASYKFTDTNWTVGGHLANAGKYDGKDETGARMIALGVQYDLSKRTNVTAYYAAINNGDAATYKFGDNGALALGADGKTAVAGSDPRVIGLGVNHKF